jgi:hypothetical protein
VRRLCHTIRRGGTRRFAKVLPSEGVVGPQVEPSGPAPSEV